MKNTRKLITGIHYASIALKSKTISLWDKEEANHYLLNQLENLPGLPAKVGQLLSRKLDTSPRPPSKPLMSLEEVKSIIHTQSPLLDDQIMEIEANGISASIGQVHKATLQDGTIVAIKVQYPGISELIDAQCDLFLSLAEKSPAKNYGWDKNTYGAYFKEQLEKELNYRREAKIQENFQDFFSSHTNFVIPKIYSGLCSQQILVQSWESSDSLNTLLQLSDAVRSQIAKRIIEFTFRNIFQFHAYHADFQPANWGCRPEEERLVVYDFGATGELTEQTVDYLLSVIYAARDGQKISGIDFFTRLGFDEKKLSYIKNDLDRVVEFFLEPFSQPSSWTLQNWKMGEKIDAVLGKYKWWLRTSGPIWFFGLMRGLEGMFYAVEQLNVPVNFWDIFSQFTQKPFHNVVSIDFQKVTDKPKEMAKNLFIYVDEGTERIVELEMPVLAVDDLEDLIPENVKEKITNQVDLKKIRESAQSSNYIPQILFEVSTSTRQYRVFLK